jgi:hypothetical protein
MIVTTGHLPFPALTAEQQQLLIQWLYSAADREARRQQYAARTQDRLRHSIRANAFRDAIAELGG